MIYRLLRIKLPKCGSDWFFFKNEENIFLSWICWMLIYTFGNNCFCPIKLQKIAEMGTSKNRSNLFERTSYTIAFEFDKIHTIINCWIDFILANQSQASQVRFYTFVSSHNYNVCKLISKLNVTSTIYNLQSSLFVHMVGH